MPDTTSNPLIQHYEPKYQVAFKELNEAWIKTYFKLEDEDRKVLEHPQEAIIDKGGAIVVAVLEGEPVGVCALVPMDDPRYDFELAKMAVAPTVQGRGIGRKLAYEILDEARRKGATRIYLESNTVLGPAIKLYRSLGFTEITDHQSPYQRCNIQMGLEL